jgi:hypothetical protein
MRLRLGILGVAGAMWGAAYDGAALAPPPAPAPPRSSFLWWVWTHHSRGRGFSLRSSTHDFGEVQVGSDTQAHVCLHQHGSATLEILQVRPSCGCTTAGEWEKRVEPGATGRIPIQFSSASFSGLIQKTVSVVTNDPRQSNVVLHIKATVWVPLEVTPKTVMFQYDSDAPTAATQTIKIISNLKEPLRVAGTAISHPAFRTELQTVKEGKEYALLVSTVPPIGTGMIAAPFFIRSSDTNVEPVRCRPTRWSASPSWYRRRNCCCRPGGRGRCGPISRSDRRARICWCFRRPVSMCPE